MYVAYVHFESDVTDNLWQYYAENLLTNNEGGGWRDPTSSTAIGSWDSQDNEIFERARKINCAVFRNFVAQDVVKGLTGRSNLDRSAGLDFLKVLVMLINLFILADLIL